MGHALLLLAFLAYCTRSGSTTLRGAHISKHAPFRIRLENANDVAYYSRITVGGQQMNAIFDTGSFDVLVVSEKCYRCPNPPYNSKVSKSYRSLDLVGHHEFGSGKTVSHLGVDEFGLGPYRVRQVIHEIVHHEIKVLDKAKFDAIVGIGARTPGATCNMSLLCNLNITEFSICLERPKGSPGWLTMGSRLTAADKAGAVALANIGKKHWAVSMRDVRVAGVQLNPKTAAAGSLLLCGEGCAAIIDSGTSLIVAPSHALNALQVMLPKLDEDCSNWHTMPDLEFSLNGQRMHLPRESYAVKLTGSRWAKQKLSSFLHFKPSGIQGDICFLGFITGLDRSSEFGPMWIFGMPFFREYHVTFSTNEDVTKRQMWLNKASATCEPEALQVQQKTEWKPTDAIVTGKAASLYPPIVVAQRESKVRQSPLKSAQGLASRAPITMRAEDLLASGGLDRWRTMDL